ncbi:MAG: radical SAM protein [Syntrophales bacterium]|nr:radical SAM protein [Syntrophales bacterium]MDD5641663.1 radical SAM protein [Syntrophales bacterium]
MATNPVLLLINPWIYDFAAYDFFARPLGLLYLASYLSSQGYAVHLLDCLDTPQARTGAFGTGRYPKEIIPTPEALRGIPRRYGRYGIREADFKARLAALPRPDAILVTSLMTYWYPGVQAAISLAREQFPAAPVILGGIYATLCPEHAREHSGADAVVTGPGEAALVHQLAALGLPGPALLPLGALDSQPYPALDLLFHLPYLPLLTSRGCPLDCSYCASRLLQPRYQRRQPSAVVEELRHWQSRLNLRDVAFYDDALLLDAENHLLVILEELAKQDLSFRFHTPNGLHARLITPEVARWLHRAPFKTLRLGVETVALGSARLDRKLQAGELEAALRYLQEAGFRGEKIGVYLLMGLPHQEENEISHSIRRVKELGGAPVLAQYAPIPGTALWPQAVAASRYDLASDPLFHNNSLFPCWPQFSWERYSRLKRLASD